MKKAKKILTLVACAVLLVCISVGATLAYLQATTDTVTNTFVAGNVTVDDPTTDLNDGLDEAKVDVYGNKIAKVNDKEVAVKQKDGKWVDANTEADLGITGTPEFVTRVINNQYKLVAGHTYIKDPTVHVRAGSEPCYVFVKVTNDIEAIEGTETIKSQIEKNWTLIEKNEALPSSYLPF